MQPDKKMFSNRVWIGLLLITIAHQILVVRSWPLRTPLGEFVFSCPVWLIAAFSVSSLLFFSVGSLKKNRASHDAPRLLAAAAIFVSLIYLTSHAPLFVPAQIAHSSDMRFAIMLAFVSFVGIPVFFSAKRHANLFNQSKICYATDVLVLFLLVLNILLLALPEIELVTGMAGTSDRTIYVSFAPKYSDVLNVIGNPLFDIPRILFNYAGIGYFSGMLTAAYYGSLAATLFSVALSTLVGRQAAFAAAFCITTSKYFLIIVFLGANIITSLLVISVGTSLLFWIAPVMFPPYLRHS